MTVFCDNYYCAYEKNGYCTKKQISIENETCDDYVHYQEVHKDKYCHNFYKAVKTKNNIPAKALCESGRKIEYQGLTFYTESKVNDGDDDFWVTEETSGLGANFEHIKKRFDLVIKSITKAPKISDLPLAEKNENDEWEIVEGEETEQEVIQRIVKWLKKKECEDESV